MFSNIFCINYLSLTHFYCLSFFNLSSFLVSCLDSPFCRVKLFSLCILIFGHGESIGIDQPTCFDMTHNFPVSNISTVFSFFIVPFVQTSYCWTLTYYIWISYPASLFDWLYFFPCPFHIFWLSIHCLVVWHHWASVWFVYMDGRSDLCAWAGSSDLILLVLSHWCSAFSFFSPNAFLLSHWACLSFRRLIEDAQQVENWYHRRLFLFNESMSWYSRGLIFVDWKHT